MKLKKMTKVFLCNLSLSGLLFQLQACQKHSHDPQDYLLPLREFSSNIDNVVFLVVDTLRADYLPFYGSSENTAPFLSSLIPHSVVYDRAFSSSSTTAPAMASVFTSTYPSTHGVITGMVAFQNLSKQNQEIKLNRIPERLLTLGEAFASAGFNAYGVADNPNISEQMGFTPGFKRFDTFRYSGASNVNNIAYSWPVTGGKNFYYIHYMDPHQPYHPQTPWFKDSVRGLRERVKSAYQSEIRYTDEHIKALFQHFGWKNNALVIFVADHGEEFWERGNAGHGKTLYTEVTRVPMFIYHPSLKNKRVKEVVRSLDLLPTLVDIFGLQPNQQFEGFSLLSKDSYFQPAFLQLLRHEAQNRKPIYSVIAEQHQYIKTDQGDSHKFELYDLRNDFMQMADLHESKGGLTTRLGKLLESEPHHSKPHREETIINLDQEGIENLKSLGYIH